MIFIFTLLGQIPDVLPTLTNINPANGILNFCETQIFDPVTLCFQDLCGTSTITEDLAAAIEKDPDYLKCQDHALDQKEAIIKHVDAELDYYRNSFKLHQKDFAIRQLLKDVSFKCDSNSDNRITTIYNDSFNQKSLEHQTEVKRLTEWIASSKPIGILYPCGYFKDDELMDMFTSLTSKIDSISYRLQSDFPAVYDLYQDRKNEIFANPTSITLVKNGISEIINLIETQAKIPSYLDFPIEDSSISNILNEHKEEAKEYFDYEFKLNELIKNKDEPVKILLTLLAVNCIENEYTEKRMAAFNKIKDTYFISLVKSLNLKDTQGLKEFIDKIELNLIPRSEYTFTTTSFASQIHSSHTNTNLLINIGAPPPLPNIASSTLSQIGSTAVIEKPASFDPSGDAGLIKINGLWVFNLDINDIFTYAHEISHAVHIKYFKEDGSSPEFNEKFQKIINCINDLHPGTPKANHLASMTEEEVLSMYNFNISKLNNGIDSVYLMEDLADTLAASLGQKSKDLCSSHYLQLSNPGDEHSSDFFRLIYTNYLMGVYPDSCRKVIASSNGQHQLKKCIDISTIKTDE